MVAPSTVSRTMSPWPACRASSSIRCHQTQRTDHASTSFGNHGASGTGTGVSEVEPAYGVEHGRADLVVRRQQVVERVGLAEA